MEQTQRRNIRHYLWLVLKGIGMGAADVVPGVSGGTIAFLVGIYEELIDSIKRIDLNALRLFFTGKWISFWSRINGNFLLSIVIGVGISILSLAHGITYLLATYPILVWSFFFGLVVASAYFVSKRITHWTVLKGILLVAGAVLAYIITDATPAQTPNGLAFIFLCGAIAICAMILPGISGSFILVLLGKYLYVMEAVKTFNFPVIVVFAVGAALGLVLFSKLLSYLLHHFYDFTIALLTGFMIGSLNKVWPWKEILPDGIEINCAPTHLLLPAIGLAVFGFLIVYIIEIISAKAEKKRG